jgi:hypothetical protein
MQGWLVPRRTITTLATLLLAACGPAQPSTGDESSSSGTGPAPTTEPGAGSSSSGSIGGTTVVDGTTMLDDAISVGSPDVPPDLPSECVDWALRGCGSTRARTAVSGTTPLGDFATTVAVFGGNMTCHQCELFPNIELLYLVADPAVIDELEPYEHVDETLVLHFSFFDGPTGRQTGVQLEAARDGVRAETYADVVIDYVPTVEELMDPYDPLDAVVVTGTLTAEGNGWSMAGTFAASYCPAVNVAWPCD